MQFFLNFKLYKNIIWEIHLIIIEKLENAAK